MDHSSWTMNSNYELSTMIYELNNKVMETEYTGPGNGRDDNQFNKERDNNDAPHNPDKGKTLENSGPDKSKDFKVLHQDGSLGDLKDQDVPGGGALDGTIGLGT